MNRLRLGLAHVCGLSVWLLLMVLYLLAAVQVGIANPPDFVIPLGNGTSIEAFLSHNTCSLLPWMSCDYYDGPPISTYVVFYVERTSHSVKTTPMLVWRVAPRYPNDRDRTSSLPSVPQAVPPTMAPPAARLTGIPSVAYPLPVQSTVAGPTVVSTDISPASAYPFQPPTTISSPTAALSLPTVMPTAVMPQVRRCRSQDLYAIWGAVAGATMGWVLANALLANTTPTACFLSGVPTVQLIDAKGMSVNVAVTMVNDCGPTGTCPPNRVVVLLPGLPRPVPHQALLPGHAWFGLDWHIRDGTGEACPSLGIITQLRVILPASQDAVTIVMPSNILIHASCDLTVHAINGIP